MPMIGLATSATIKRHTNTRRKPKSRLIVSMPKVAMQVLFAGYSSQSDLGLLPARCDRGYTQTSASVFTRNCCFVTLSVIKRQRAEEMMGSLAAIRDSPALFPICLLCTDKARCTCQPGPQNTCGTIRCHLDVRCSNTIASLNSASGTVGGLHLWLPLPAVGCWQ